MTEHLFNDTVHTRLPSAAVGANPPASPSNMGIAVYLQASHIAANYLELRVTLNCRGETFHYLQTLERDHMMSVYDRLMAEATVLIKDMVHRHITGDNRPLQDTRIR